MTQCIRETVNCIFTNILLHVYKFEMRMKYESRNKLWVSRAHEKKCFAIYLEFPYADVYIYG